MLKTTQYVHKQHLKKGQSGKIISTCPSMRNLLEKTIFITTTEIKKWGQYCYHVFKVYVQLTSL